LGRTEEGLRGTFDYDHALSYLQTQGIKYFGSHFKIHEADIPLIKKLLCYFLKDEATASQLSINLNKGILLTGPVGCGKTSLMFLMRFFLPYESRYILKSCRDISFEFIKDGYPIISKYSHHSFKNNQPLAYCFDDMGTENNLKLYGNECNTMAEILLSRYDLFISRKLLTHITTNLSASEIETLYGNRVRSRMRELFNLIAFEKDANDKRK
jgi:energy-coupling factor transporter ATP-binding protein EcfA2